MQQIQAKTQLRTKKMVLTAMLACLAFVLNTYVYFPSMAPFQHFVDVIAAVLLGPWYAWRRRLSMRDHADDVRPDHSGSGRRRFWTHPGRTHLSKDP